MPPVVNPFPLNIVRKENSPFLLAWLQQFGRKWYADADDLNKIIDAVQYVYENMNNDAGPVPDGDSIMVYDVTTDSQETLNNALINIFSAVAYFDLHAVATNGATTSIPLNVADDDGNYTTTGPGSIAGNSNVHGAFLIEGAAVSFLSPVGRYFRYNQGAIILKSAYDGQPGGGGELHVRSDSVPTTVPGVLTIQAPAKIGSFVWATTDDIIDSVEDAIAQLINGAPSDANTLKELNDKILAINAIIGGTAADGDSLVNTVAELLAVFQTYPEGSDIAVLLSAKIASSDIVNNLTQVVAGKVLDGRQGKILKDLIDALSATVATNTANIAINTAAINANTASILLRNRMMIKVDQHIVAPGWNTNALNSVIGASYVLSGSLTARLYQDTNLFTRTARVGIVSTATAGNAVTGRQTVGYFSRNTGFYFTFKFGSSEGAALSSTRSFIGMTGPNNLSQNVEPDMQTNALGVARISSSSNWQILHNDSTGVATVHDTLFPANTENDELYEAIIRSVPAGVEFTLKRLSNATEYQYTAITDIPAANYALALFFMSTNNTNAALSGVDWAGHNLYLGN